jgi:putative SOS response-associated peptidase YedK
MCNDVGNHIPYSEYLAAFSQTRITVKWPNAVPSLVPRDDIWPTDKAPVIRRLEDGTNEFSEIRWGFPPAQLEPGEGSFDPDPPIYGQKWAGARFPFRQFSARRIRSRSRRSASRAVLVSYNFRSEHPQANRLRSLLSFGHVNGDALGLC